MKTLRLLPLLTFLVAMQSFAANTARQVVDSTAFVFEQAFVDAARGKEIAAGLRAAKIDPKLEGAALAEAVQKTIRAMENDAHLQVTFDAARSSEPMATKEQIDERINHPDGPARQRMRPPTAGQITSRMLDNNIGYVAIESFPDPDDARDEFAAAFKAVENASAVILDLRQNHGGTQQMVNFVSSYFLPADDRVLLTSTFRTRPQPFVSRTVETPTRKLENVPLAILTSANTVSAGEACAYILQQFGRGKVVGWKTKGGGRHNIFVDIGGGYTVSVSMGSTQHPKSGTGWQGTGVIPDVQVAAKDAVEEAVRMLTK
ncbi:MAG: S41 family peptidase [Acidobacteriota bacterium]|nr:S41 family peptidase [Acidobacteriota bacterium]